jgi:UDP-glucose 4-epimerase
VVPEFAPERSVNPVPRRLASTEKAERLLGFQAEIPLQSGLRELVNWWRAERHSAVVASEREALAS